MSAVGRGVSEAKERQISSAAVLMSDLQRLDAEREAKRQSVQPSQSLKFNSMRELGYAARHTPEIFYGMTKEEYQSRQGQIEANKQQWTSLGYPQYAGKYAAPSVPPKQKIQSITEDPSKQTLKIQYASTEQSFPSLTEQILNWKPPAQGLASGLLGRVVPAPSFISRPTSTGLNLGLVQELTAGFVSSIETPMIIVGQQVGFMPKGERLPPAPSIEKPLYLGGYLGGQVALTVASFGVGELIGQGIERVGRRITGGSQDVGKVVSPSVRREGTDLTRLGVGVPSSVKSSVSGLPSEAVSNWTSRAQEEAGRIKFGEAMRSFRETTQRVQTPEEMIIEFRKQVGQVGSEYIPKSQRIADQSRLIPDIGRYTLTKTATETAIRSSSGASMIRTLIVPSVRTAGLGLESARVSAQLNISPHWSIDLIESQSLERSVGIPKQLTQVLVGIGARPRVSQKASSKMVSGAQTSAMLQNLGISESQSIGQILGMSTSQSVSQSISQSVGQSQSVSTRLSESQRVRSSSVMEDVRRRFPKRRKGKKDTFYSRGERYWNVADAPMMAYQMLGMGKHGKQKKKKR
jgi:hypothetical protein